MSALLAGIRVLDLSNVLAGPFCGYQLALLGADVIKVESPDGGDLARQLGADTALNRRGMGASFIAQNAQKRSVVLDLKSEEGRTTFLQLVATADVVLENFRPGVMDRLGLGAATLRAQWPGLIYCAISGFGQDGPLSKAPAYDQIIQGRSGAMSITGDEQSAPLRVGYPVSDTCGGLTAAFAIAAALVRRACTGEGASLDVSMLDATIGSMGWVVSNLLLAGQEPVPMGNDNFTASPSGAFRTGKGLLNIAANKQEQFEALCRVVGAPEWLADPRFAQREARKTHRQALREALEGRLSTEVAQVWEDRLNAAGVPAGLVLSVPEALAQAQVQHDGLITTVPAAPTEETSGDTPSTGSWSVAGAGFRVDGVRPVPSIRPPLLGEHTDAVRASLLRERP